MAEKPDKAGKLDKVLEGYKPIPMKRLFYPRGMKLSEDFVNAFHREYDRLVDEGSNPKNLVDRFGKAMKFHQGEPRVYKQLDEEKAAQELEEKKKMSEEELQDDVMSLKPDPHEGNRGPRTGKRKPDEDGDGVPDWADKKPGKDDHHKSSAKGTKKHKKKHK